MSAELPQSLSRSRRRWHRAILVLAVIGVGVLFAHRWYVSSLPKMLLTAITRNDREGVERALRLGAKTEGALSHAIYTQRYDAVEPLLRYGADPNGRPPGVDSMSESAQSPLYHAAVHGRLDVVRILVEHGADVNRASPNGVRPLEQAIANAEVLAYLIRHGADIHAGRCGDIAVKSVITSVDTQWLTSLKLLLSLGASPNYQGQDGRTAVSMAVLSGPIIEGHESDASYPYPRSGRGRQAGAVEIEAGVRRQLAALSLLVKHGAKLNVQDMRGETPLMLSIQRYPEITRFLLDHGANLRLKNNIGETALMMAEKRHLPIHAALIKQALMR
jgi:uncharacterized protein